MKSPTLLYKKKICLLNDMELLGLEKYIPPQNERNAD
jgi:hypothetical protein